MTHFVMPRLVAAIVGLTSVLGLSVALSQEEGAATDDSAVRYSATRDRGWCC